jgi:2-keto-4-pentenoate hydratase/2-oxohepta-3-ene-1,7-dioic acid hydratase in catechol pathway
MKLASYILDGQPTWGVLQHDQAIHTGKTLSSTYPDLKSLLAANALDQVEAAMAASAHSPVDSLQWLPVIPNPDKILCVGLNYEKHRKETGRVEVQHPTIFGRYANTQTAHLANILRPRVSTDLDFEGELAIVIGKRARYIKAAEAFDYVAGYSCYNDASVRDWQYHTHQFTPGKNFPATGAFGPWMVTPDELGELSGLRISTRLNGEVVQNAHLGDMIFNIPTILEYCSAFNQLEPGDVIVTGTPGGVGVKRTPQLWMKPGDTVEVEIERLGTLRNTIADEPEEA